MFGKSWKMGIGEHRAAAYFPLNAEALKLRSSQGNVKVDAIHIGNATTSCLGEKVIKMQHAFLIKDYGLRMCGKGYVLWAHTTEHTLMLLHPSLQKSKHITLWTASSFAFSIHPSTIPATKYFHIHLFPYLSPTYGTLPGSLHILWMAQNICTTTDITKKKIKKSKHYCLQLKM